LVTEVGAKLPLLFLVLGLRVGETEQRSESAEGSPRETHQEAAPRAAVEGTCEDIETLSVHGHSPEHARLDRKG